MSTSNNIPAVFLDRDGTIIEDRGHLRSSSEVVFFPESVSALKRLQEHYLLFIVTHQPGITRGLVSSDEVASVNEHVVSELLKQGVTISAVYCCPHTREVGCACIKPNPYFLHEAARDHGIDLAASFVVGDHPHDVVLADNAGATGIFVLTGHGTKHRAELPKWRILVPGIREAAEWILTADSVHRGSRKQPETNTALAEKNGLSEEEFEDFRKKVAEYIDY